MAGRRICVAAPQVPYLRGGAELHTELLVSALRGEGHDVELVTLPYIWTGDEGSLQQCLAWRMVDLATEIAGIDLVIATKFPSYLIRHPNKVAWIFHQQREVYDLHATPFGRLSAGEGDRGLRQALVELDLQGLVENRALFANSRNTAARLERYCGMQASALYAPPKLHKELHPGPYGDYLLYVGRLDRIKRLDLTIRALAETSGTFVLKVAGKGPHLEELRRAAAESGVSDRVEFLGFVSDEAVVELYAGVLRGRADATRRGLRVHDARGFLRRQTGDFDGRRGWRPGVGRGWRDGLRGFSRAAAYRREDRPVGLR